MNRIWLILVLCCATSVLANGKVFSIINSGNHRIVGGTDATFGEFPYQGLLIIRISSSEVSLCGCSLISAEWAITAAHCTYESDASQVNAIFGTIQYTASASDSNEPQERGVSDVYVHQSYNDATMENDISLLRLSTPVMINNYAAPISLPPTGDDLVEIEESSCVITGWGKTSDGGNIPEILQKANIPLIDNSLCQEMITQISPEITIHKEQVCAGYEQGGIDACQGDSGGPLACLSTTSNEFILIGVTSFGIGCAQPRSPGVYARVSSYRDWIDDTMQTGEIPNSTTALTTWSSTTSGAGSKSISHARKIFLAGLLVLYLL